MNDEPRSAVSILSLFAEHVHQRGEAIALRAYRSPGFTSFSWRHLGDDVLRLTSALARLRVEKGDRVVQFSENRYEWIIVDLALQSLQAVHVPVHAPLTGTQAAWQIQNSGARLALFSTAEQGSKLGEAASQLPDSLQLVAYESDAANQPIVARPTLVWETLLGQGDIEHGRQLQQEAIANAQADELVSILYTSGTTGEPKGVMLCHGNLVSNALSTLASFDIRPDDLRLTFLPLSHIFARTCDLYTWIASGSQLALAQNRDSVLADCAQLKPQLLNGVPYFYERVVRYLVQEGLDSQPESLRQLLGGAIRTCCSGGAALPDHLYEFFQAREVPLLQGYGLTESSPVITLSTVDQVAPGAVGKAIADVDIRIAEDGEILTRGPHVMLGYYNDPAATAEVLRDEWLYTGDLGHLDEDGFLYITGRKKEILVTSAGKNIAPVYLESLLTEDPFILQAMVLGDQRSYLTALIVPDPEVLRAEIVRQQIPVTSPADALQHPQVRALYDDRIQNCLRDVSHHEQVRKFVLLGRGFTIESGELTPKMSLRREQIQEHFAEQIEALYARDEPTSRDA